MERDWWPFDWPLQMWRWRFVDEFGKQRTTRYLLTEEDAHKRLCAPQKLGNSLEVFEQRTTNYFRPFSPDN
jgi:hypothetical protein